MSLPARLLGANPSIQVSTLLSGSLSTPSAKQPFDPLFAYELIATTTTGSTEAATTFSNIDGSRYRLLEVWAVIKGTRASTDEGFAMLINGNTSSVYKFGGLFWNNGSASDSTFSSGTRFTAGDGSADTASAGSAGGVRIQITNCNRALPKKLRSNSYLGDPSYSGRHRVRHYEGYADISEIITSLTFFCTVDSLLAQNSKISIYGIR